MVVLLLVNRFSKKPVKLVSDYFAGLGKLENDTSVPLLLPLLASVLSTVFLGSYVLYIGGDWMPGSRYVMHFLVLFRVVSTAVMVHFLFYIYRHHRKLAFYTALGLLLAVFTGIITLESRDSAVFHELYTNGNPDNIPRRHAFYTFWGRKPARKIFTLYADFIDRMKEVAPVGSTIAFYEAGCTAVQLGDDFRFIDLSGLNDPVLARNNLGEGYYSLCLNFVYYPDSEIRGPKDQYIVDQDPYYIVFDNFLVTPFHDGEVPESIFGGKYILTYELDNTPFFVVYKRWK
jgi:hypothetical protein